jgi:hypothetical protein
VRLIAEEMRFWNADARGHWNGTTLVIDTTNFSSKTPFRAAREVPVTGEHVHLTERLTPVDANTLRYEVTVDDPTHGRHGRPSRHGSVQRTTCSSMRATRRTTP